MPITTWIILIILWLVLGFVGRCIMKSHILRLRTYWLKSDEIWGIGFTIAGVLGLVASLLTAMFDYRPIGFRL